MGTCVSRLGIGEHPWVAGSERPSRRVGDGEHWFWIGGGENRLARPADAGVQVFDWQRHVDIFGLDA